MDTEETFKNISLLFVSFFIKRMKILGAQKQEKPSLTKDNIKMDH